VRPGPPPQPQADPLGSPAVPQLPTFRSPVPGRAWSGGLGGRHAPCVGRRRRNTRWSGTAVSAGRGQHVLGRSRAHRQLVDKAAKVAGDAGVCRRRRQQRQTYWVLPPRPIVFAVRTCARAHPAWPMSYLLVTGNGSGVRSPRSGARRSPAAACWPASHRPPGPARSPRCNRQTRGDAAARPPLARRGSDGRTRS
jgi:hypothetical protein